MFVFTAHIGYHVVLPSSLGIVGNDIYFEGQTIHLSCRVMAYPQPAAIVWVLRNSNMYRPLYATSRLSMSGILFTIENGEPYSRNELYINDANSDDSGDYICVVSADGYTNVQISVQPLAVTCEEITSPLSMVLSLSIDNFLILQLKISVISPTHLA